MLQLYNSLTRSKETFVPINPGKIGLYVCGMTVYDRCHLGHARSLVCFDVMVRFLRAQGYEVHFVRNITDVDDKIIDRALERGIDIDVLTTQYIQAMHDDMQALSVLKSDVEPRATDNIPAMIALIERLLASNHAYVAGNGDVCYAVSQFADYGKLSKQDLDALQTGIRVRVEEGKRAPVDFVLWKLTKPNEPSWPSPWGAGRPGWHIECSAMSMQTLGEHFDIHGGGLDLQFPHHENEIAQSEAVTGKTYANYWLHVGLLQINGEKMSKSTGNFFTIESVLQQHHPEVLRYFLMSSHYRSPLNYSEEHLMLALKALSRLYQALNNAPNFDEAMVDTQWALKFDSAMNDDFNTPMALSVLFDLSHELNRNPSAILGATLKHLGGVLGLLQLDPQAFLKTGLSLDESSIEALIAQRLEARAAKDWKKADALRDELLNVGVELQDGPDGTTWRTVV